MDRNSTTSSQNKSAKLKRPARKPSAPNGEAEVLQKIASMPEPYRTMGQRLHEIIRQSGPELVPKLWYGMPAYSKNEKVLCFFRGGQMFKERYMTLGFNNEARLDEGGMWPIAYALTELTDLEASRIGALVRKAIG